MLVRVVLMRMMMAVMVVLVLLRRDSRVPIGVGSCWRRRRCGSLMLHAEISKHGLDCIGGIQLLQSVLCIVAEQCGAVLVFHHLVRLRLVRAGAAMQPRCGVRRSAWQLRAVCVGGHGQTLQTIQRA